MRNHSPRRPIGVSSSGSMMVIAGASVMDDTLPLVRLPARGNRCRHAAWGEATCSHPRPAGTMTWMKSQQLPLLRPWHQTVLSGVAAAAVLGLLELSADAAAAPTTPGSVSLTLASSAQTSVGVPRTLSAASTTLTEYVTNELGTLDASRAR